MTAVNETGTQENTITDPTLTQSEPIETTPEPQKEDGRFSGIFSFLRRGQPWLEISGYHVGDIQSEDPVAIRQGTTVVGNVNAPKILVAGLINGSATAQEITVEDEGQVWGDVFTVSLQIKPGGVVQGWISSVSEADYQAMQAGSLQADTDLAQFAPPDLAEGNGESAIIQRSDAQIEALHLLQLETATALAARAELESDFEKRLHEVAGEASSTVAHLNEKLAELQTDLAQQEQQFAEVQEALQQSNLQIERQTNEINMSRELLDKQNKELTQLRQAHTQLEENHTLLQTERDELDEALTSARRQIDALTDRITSLEVAHMASLQHSAEQEDSLIRWQELAETTEKRAQEVSDELEKVQYQMEESQSTIELLRQHRTDLERELNKALTELEDLRKRNTEPIVPPAALAAATEKIFRLEGQLKAQKQKYTDQIRYYKTGLDKTQTALTAVQEQLENQAEELTDLRDKVSTQAALLQQWQTAVTEKENALQRQSELFVRKQELMDSEKKNLQITLRESKAQLEAYEDEVAQYIKMTQDQGQHLAEVQDRLVERELQLKQAMARLEKARTMIEKQNTFIKEMKRVTQARMQKLQAQITRLQKNN